MSLYKISSLSLSSLSFYSAKSETSEMELPTEPETPSTFTMLGLMSVFITVPLGIDAAIPELDIASPSSPESLYQLNTTKTMSETAAMRRESSASWLKTKNPRWFWQ